VIFLVIIKQNMLLNHFHNHSTNKGRFKNIMLFL